MELFSVLLLLLLFSTLLYYLIKRQYSLWHRMGVPYVEPIFPYGNLKDVGKKFHICQLLQSYYNQFKDKTPFVGLYFFFSRVVLITDIELLRNIMLKDFNIFNARQFYHNEKDDPLSAHLFAIDGIKWKILRAKLTPTFTTGKMKFMFPTVINVGDRLRNRLIEMVGERAEVNMKDYWARFTTDVIGSCGFGVECNTLNDKNAQFREMGRIVFEEPRRGLPLQSLANHMIWAGNLLKVKQVPDAPAKFFMNMVKETVALRELHGGGQHKDFMSLLIDLKNNPDKATGLNGLTIEELAAQCFVFFVAGFETSSTLLSFCSCELSIHQDIQEKARQEAQEVFKKYGGQFTYEAVSELKYIEQVLNEALRKYPPLVTLTRAPNADYQVPGSKHYIPKGCTVIIPVYAIHHDPELYPDPEKFDPERFTPEAVAKRNSFSFLPFGEGPRNCIGLRFGMMQSKIALATVLLNFKMSLSPKMKMPLSFAKRQPIISCEGGVWLNMERIN